MGISKTQLRRLIGDALSEFQELTGIGVSKSATELLMLTAAVESDLGRFWYQKGSGPALGIFQMEPATFFDLHDNFIRYRDTLRSFMEFKGGCDSLHQLQYDLYTQIITARIHYLRVPEALPPNNPKKLAEYWKKYYNTHLGKGTVEGAVEKYNRYCV